MSDDSDTRGGHRGEGLGAEEGLGADVVSESMRPPGPPGPEGPRRPSHEEVEEPLSSSSVRAGLRSVPK